jgi:DNA-binding transcriptional LysR family regulator
MLTPPDPRLLATFRVVASTGRISAAAKILHLSQPAVTAQVHKLEATCDKPLLVRSARGVTPTDAGRLLLGYAERFDALLQEAAEALACAGGEAGELGLAASTTIASYVLPPLIAEFVGSAAVSVRVEVGNTEQILERVRSGAAPLGLVEGHARAAGVRLEPFLKDELVVVVARDAPAELAGLRRACDLQRVPIIWREPGSGTRAVVERALRNAIGRRAPHPRDVEMGAIEAIKGAALAGLGVAFLSRWSIRAEIATGRLRVLPFADLSVPRSFSWALPAGGAAGAAKSFLRFAQLKAPGLAP